MTTASIHLGTEQETRQLAERIAPLLRPGDTLLLVGEIGAGKTFFARALIQARLRAAGMSEDVPSPTFTLVQTYSDGVHELWHADLYRLGSPDEIVELGLDEAFESAICLIEWPEKLGSLAPPDPLQLTFEAGSTETERRVHLNTPGQWRARLAHLQGASLVD